MNLEHCEQEVIHTGIRFPFPKDVTPEERAWLIERIMSVGYFDFVYKLSFSEDGELIARDPAESKGWTREGWAPAPGDKLYTSVTRAVECLLLEGPRVPGYQPLERADDSVVEQEIDRRVQERRSAIDKCLHSSPFRLLLNVVPFASTCMRNHDSHQRYVISHALFSERWAARERHEAGQMQRLQTFLDEHASELAQALRDTVAASARAKQQAEKYRQVPHLDIPLEEVRLRKIRIAGYPASVEYRQNSVMIYIQVAPRSTYAVLVHKGETVQLGEGDQRFSGVECSHPREGTLARLSASGAASLEITLEEWKFREPKLLPRD